MNHNKISSKETIKRLLGYIFKGNILKMTVVFISILVSSLASVVAVSFVETLVDDYIKPLLSNSSDVGFTDIFNLLMIVGIISLIGVICIAVYNLIMTELAEDVLRVIRNDMFEHMETLPIKYFDTNSHGDIMSNYTNDTDTLSQMISVSIPQLFVSIITIIVVFFTMVYTSIYLTLVVLLSLVLVLSVTKSLSKKSSQYFIQQQNRVGKLNGYVEEMISGQKVIKIFNHENKVVSDFIVQNKNVGLSIEKANTIASVFMPIMMNLGDMQYILIAITGGILMNLGIGGITIGAILSFLMLSRSFTNPVTQISQQVNSVIQALAGASRIFSLLDELSEEDEGKVTLYREKDESSRWSWHEKLANGETKVIPFVGEVTLENVNFSYVPEKPVLKDISIYAGRGEKVALVGATGAGKTTITNLLNRFYDINSGIITVDGIDINKIKKSDLRHSLGMVLQDTTLFTDSVMENIRFGNLEASDEEIILAAKKANAHGFIERLPHGYQTMLSGNGENLSQGQKQLLSIARAIVANPPILILDEATSSIDTRTEFLVQSGMDELMKGRTVFVIAHRLSTIKNSDVIMVMEHGVIIERGNHEKLLSLKGKYYDLYMGNFELE